MQFHDIRPTSRAAMDAKPTVRLINNTVLIGIPLALAERRGLTEGAAVRLQFGEDDSGAVAVRIAADPHGGWKVRVRKKVISIYSPELYPSESHKSATTSYTESADGLTLELPSPWTLQNPHVVMRREAKPAKTRAG